MRPIDKGVKPDKPFSDYRNARGELIKRLGEYCSYCEMHLDTSLAVEHIKPKKPEGAEKNIPERELDWDNFLLSCTNCNSTKSNKDVVMDDYFWPHKDNTFRAIIYSEGGLIESSGDLNKKLKAKAENTIKLTGLDKQPGNTLQASDRRWLNRKESWDIAMRTKHRLAENNNEDFKKVITELAVSKGYWSIWMTVFKNDYDMLYRFIHAFPGTDSSCFDSKGIPLKRKDGQI